MAGRWQLDADWIKNRACLSLIQKDRTWKYHRFANGDEEICYYQDGERIEISPYKLEKIEPELLWEMRRKWDAIELILGR